MIDSVDLLAVVVRAASFVAALQAAGIALFIAMYRRQLQASFPPLVKLGSYSGIAALVFVLFSQALNAARMAGDLAGMWDKSLTVLSWISSSGAATAMRMLGVAALMVGLRVDGKRLLAFGAAFVIASFALTGHTTTFSPRSALTPLLTLHLAIVVFWFGALPGLLAVVKHDASVQVVALFSRSATYLVPALAGAGLIMAWILLPNVAALATPYGIALICKIAGFALLMLLAAINKLRFVPAMERGERDAFAGFAVSARVEYVLVVAVLCATATMTTLFSPD